MASFIITKLLVCFIVLATTYVVPGEAQTGTTIASPVAETTSTTMEQTTTANSPPSAETTSSSSSTALNLTTSPNPAGTSAEAPEGTPTSPPTTSTTSTSMTSTTSTTRNTSIPASSVSTTMAPKGSFDIGSFFGGFVLCLAIVVIIYLGCKLFRNKKPDYNTL